MLNALAMKPVFLALGPTVTEFFIHFFPLLTIFLFLTSAVFFIRYMNSIRKIEDHMAANRPDEWEDLGKPSIFSGLSSEKRAKFREFLESETPENIRDIHMTMLWERSKNLKKILKIITWSAFGMYAFTIFAVNYLLGKFS